MTQQLKCKTFIFKIASRCNLNCSYCYMYNKGDLSYRSLPKFMTDETIRSALYRIHSHCLLHRIDEVLIAFHGGEPMLLGLPYYKKFIEHSHRILGSEIKIFFAIQTNGLLINKEWADFFKEHNIKIGISLDGTKAENDQYRVDHKGNGSYDEALRGYQVASMSGNDAGILSVINIKSDPILSYRHFKTLGAPYIDYLLPYNTYDDPPPGLETNGSEINTPYADWLIAIFDAWFNDKEAKPDIRLFSGIIYSILGFEFPVDLLGEYHNELMVIETDGGIEAVDALKICGHRFTKADMNVLTHDFDSALKSDLAYVYHMSHSLLPSQCLSCPVKEVCGGGYLPHRFRKSNGFNNPSLFCHDLLKLITHIQTEVKRALPEQIVQDGELADISFSDALQTIASGHANSEEPGYSHLLSQFAISNSTINHGATNIKM